MKTQLIKLQDKYILVSDEEIKKGDWVTNEVEIFTRDSMMGYSDEYANRYWQKIIAGIPELPSIDFSLLSEEDCKTIGWIDVEKLAVELCLDAFPKHDDNSFDEAISLCKDFYVEGFKAAQSLNDKMFSLEDMSNFSKWVADSKKHGYAKQLYEAMIVNKVNTVEELILIWQSLQQTVWDVEIEMGIDETIEPISTGNYSHKDDYYYKPKITNNSIKINRII